MEGISYQIYEFYIVLPSFYLYRLLLMQSEVQLAVYVYDHALVSGGLVCEPEITPWRKKCCP